VRNRQRRTFAVAPPRSLGLVAAVLSLGLMVTACGSGSTSSASGASTSVVASSTSGTAGAATSAPATGPPATATPAASTHGKRYCEVLLVRVVDGQGSADVYNSYPLNECPAELFTKLDPKAIASTEGVTLASLNGPRFWLMDRIEKPGGTAALPKKDFGGIEMYRQASLDIGPLADATKPYTAHEVDRATVFVFDAGATVYELSAPDGSTYVMQTWSQQKIPTLAEADLAGLGSRLQPPAGWTYRARTLDAPLRVVTTTTKAKVLQDELGNSYSQETPNN